MSEPVFEITDTPRGKLVTCVIDGEFGAARVLSKGEQDARDRAEQQARAKLEARREPAE